MNQLKIGESLWAVPHNSSRPFRYQQGRVSLNFQGEEASDGEMRALAGAVHELVGQVLDGGPAAVVSLAKSVRGNLPYIQQHVCNPRVCVENLRTLIGLAEAYLREHPIQEDAVAMAVDEEAGGEGADGAERVGEKRARASDDDDDEEEEKHPAQRRCLTGELSFWHFGLLERLLNRSSSVMPLHPYLYATTTWRHDVELVVGPQGDTIVLAAHRSILEKTPFFSQLLPQTSVGHVAKIRLLDGVHKTMIIRMLEYAYAGWTPIHVPIDKKKLVHLKEASREAGETIACERQQIWLAIENRCSGAWPALSEYANKRKLHLLGVQAYLNGLELEGFPESAQHLSPSTMFSHGTAWGADCNVVYLSGEEETSFSFVGNGVRMCCFSRILAKGLRNTPAASRELLLGPADIDPEIAQIWFPDAIQSENSRERAIKAVKMWATADAEKVVERVKALCRFADQEGFSASEVVNELFATHLNTIDVQENSPQQKAAEAWEWMQHLGMGVAAHLTVLDLNAFSAWATGEFVVGLVQRTPQLESLRIERCHGLTDASLTKIAACCRDLKVLIVGGSAITDACIDSLTQLPLRVLYLIETAITPAGAGGLSSIRTLIRFDYKPHEPLELNHDQVDCLAPLLARIQVLGLRNCTFEGPNEVNEFMQAFLHPSRKKKLLLHNHLMSMPVFARFGTFIHRLATLNLQISLENPLTDEDATHFFIEYVGKNNVELKELVLQGMSWVNDLFIKQLFRPRRTRDNGGYPYHRLKTLNLSGTSVSDQMLRRIMINRCVTEKIVHPDGTAMKWQQDEGRQARWVRVQ